MKQLSPIEVVTLGTKLAIILAQDKSIEEIHVIRNIASQISATLLTLTSQQLLLKIDEKKKK